MIKGLIAGSYDLIHPGYIMSFAEAKTQCDYLIAALQDDPTIERPHKNKPVQTLNERYLILSSIKYIDLVVVYNIESELCNILRVHRPDIRFLGDDYRNKTEEEVAGYDICPDIYYLSRTHGYSTTKLKEQIVESFKNE